MFPINKNDYMQIPSLKDIVYNYISDSIQNGTLKAYDKINETDIVNTLNISRTPIREALIQLAAEGLLESRPRRGFVVKPLTIREAKDIYAIIGRLDAFAIELALPKLTDSDITLMSNLINKMYNRIKLRDFKAYYQQQLDFHNVYILKSDNSELIETLSRLRRRFVRQSYDSTDLEELSKALNNSNDEHSLIIKLIKQKDLIALKKLLIEEHWSLNYASNDTVY